MGKPSPSSTTTIYKNLEALLQNSMKAKALQPGKQVHTQLLTTGIGMKVESLYSTLVGMYAGCGDVTSAQKLFEEMPKPTVFAWNWMISSLAFQGHCDTSLSYFSQMQTSEAFPNKFTFSCALKACVGLLDVEMGEELHCMIRKMGFEGDVSVMNALIDMYCKCGRLDSGRLLFDGMIDRDVASWTSMICGYSHVGKIEESLMLFEKMSEEGLEPNEFTWNVMVSGYARGGDCDGAFKLVERMSRRGLRPDLITWNALIAGFVRSDQNVNALTVFGKMLGLGFKPNAVTIAGLLPACGSMGVINRGKQVHGVIYRRSLEVNIYTVTALIDMYSKCGYVKDARCVFEQIEAKSVPAWNAMIGCYGKHGMVDASILLFERMNEERVQANAITYTCLLSACSHAGLVEKGLEIFTHMEENEKVLPSEEHYSCVIDLLSRAGKLAEAYEVMKKMPVNVNDSILGAFFNGCRIHERGDLARKMAEEMLGMEIRRPDSFVSLSNIYAADREWEWVENARKIMREKGIFKKAGFSWVQKNNEIAY